MGAEAWEEQASRAELAFEGWKGTSRLARRALLEAWLGQVALVREELATAMAV